MGFSDLVDLWVIKDKKPVILCARRMSISSEQNMKRRSRSESIHKVCLLYSKIKRSYDYQTWPTHFFRNSRGAQRFMGFFSWCVFRRPIDWADKRQSHCKRASSESHCCKACLKDSPTTTFFSTQTKSWSTSSDCSAIASDKHSAIIAPEMSFFCRISSWT